MSKDTAEESRAISTSWLKKNGYFNGWKYGTITWTSSDDSKSSIGLTIDTEDQVAKFVYTQTSWDGEKREMNYTHGILTTPCNFGGLRYWFRCDLRVSGRYCGRRVGVLYKSPGSWYWGCRHCHNLAYYSQQQARSSKYSGLFRAVDLETKAEKLEERIKRSVYAGRPTKKQRRLNRIYEKLGFYYRLLGQK